MPDPSLSAAARALGRAGGKKGGRSKSKKKLAAVTANLQKARKTLPSPEARRARAQAAAAARWAKKKEAKDG